MTSNLRRRLAVTLIFAAAVSAAGIDIDALICKFWTRCLRGSEQDRTRRSKLQQAQRPHMVRLSDATGKRIRALSTACN
jgi:hypothetical protein